ncbi:OTU domain-containing protein 7B-like [Glandiceps talaboti]
MARNINSPVKDSILSDFINVTKAEPGLARDLLEAQQWDLEKARKDFNRLTWDKEDTPPKTRLPPSTKPASLSSTAVTSKSTSTGMSSPSKLKRTPLATDEVNGSRNLSGGKKAVLARSSAIDETAPESPREKRLTRGISRANQPLVDEARKLVQMDEESHSHALLDTPIYSFVLPDLTIYEDDYRAFLEKDLIEMATLVTLEQAGRLNWWAQLGTCERLWPMATTGDGNCLLHAASLGLWGFHDRLLTLRKALYAMMSSGSKMESLKRRWRYYQTQLNKESGLMYSEAEWEQEWDNLLKLANVQPRGRRKSTLQSMGSLSSVSENPTVKVDTPEEENATWESLEEFHVFVLAHVLRRPIIVVADTVLRDSNGEPFAPIPFGGIYLPLECKENDCQRSPLVLTYDAAHFSALVAMENDTADPDEDESRKAKVVIPLTDGERQLLPLHFAVDPGAQWRWEKDRENAEKVKQLALSDEKKIQLVNGYLDVIMVPVSFTDQAESQKKETMEKLETGSNKSDENKSTNGSYDCLDKPKKVGNGKDQKQKSGPFTTLKKVFATKKKNPKKKYSDSSDDGSSSGHSSLSGSSTEKPKEKRVQTVDDFRNENFIVAAKLSNKRQPIREEMVINYLKKAEERFFKEKELRRQQGNGQRRAIDPRVKTSKCMTPKCDMYATEETNYLCSNCYTKHRKAAEHMGPGRSNSYNQPKADEESRLGTQLITQKALEKRHSAPENVPSYNGVQSRGLQENCVTTGSKTHKSGTVTDGHKGGGNPAILTSNTKLYKDSDAIQALSDDLTPSQVKGQPKAVSASSSWTNTGGQGIYRNSVAKKCKNVNSGCAFYGTADTDFYCSTCFKEKTKSRAMMFSLK